MLSTYLEIYMITTSFDRVGLKSILARQPRTSRGLNAFSKGSFWAGLQVYHPFTSFTISHSNLRSLEKLNRQCCCQVFCPIVGNIQPCTYFASKPCSAFPQVLFWHLSKRQDLFFNIQKEGGVKRQDLGHMNVSLLDLLEDQDSQ